METTFIALLVFEILNFVRARAGHPHVNSCS